MLHTLKLMVRDQEFLSQRKPYPQTSSVPDQNYPNLTRTTPKSGVKNAINYSINFITTCVPQTCNMYMPPKSPMMAIKHITIFNPIQNNPTCLRISPQWVGLSNSGNDGPLGPPPTQSLNFELACHGAPPNWAPTLPWRMTHDEHSHQYVPRGDHTL